MFSVDAVIPYSAITDQICWLAQNIIRQFVLGTCIAVYTELMRTLETEKAVEQKNATCEVETRSLNEDRLTSLIIANCEIGIRNDDSSTVHYGLCKS
jgi:hypothetical protein